MRGYAAFALGAVGGGLVGGAIWYFASRKLDQSFAEGEARLAQDLGIGEQQLRERLDAGRVALTAQVRAQVEAQVPSVIDERMALYGITPQMVRDLERVLDYGHRVGVL